MIHELENIYYIGSFSETVNEEGQYIKIGELFSAGIHRGVTYTEEDIKHLAREFTAEDDIPVQIDHSESALNTVGFVKEVYAQGRKLMGKLHIIDPEAQKRIDKGLMKKLSISFYLKRVGSQLKPDKIREVSLVAFPQVKGAQLFNEQDVSETIGDIHKRVNNKIEKLQETGSSKNNDFDAFYEEYCKVHGYGEVKARKTQSDLLMEQYREQKEAQELEERWKQAERYVQEELKKLEAKERK
ncbi:hypothetical protein [Bacillus licheniformis]|uniref:hypothetical protein n=1 Tax=Bacillus licheniformis TaxID=1402 RepID=UPI002E1B4372|nr:hypothetical protein [Bacillus licheniformis]